MKTEEQKKPMVFATIILAVLLIAGIGILIYWFVFSRYVGTDDAAIDGNHVSISAKIMGRVRNLAVDEGATVTTGQLLVQLDDTDLRAQEVQATASLDYANQNVILAKVNLDRSEADFDRTKTLMDTGNATKEQYDHAVKTLDAPKSNIRSPRRKWKLPKPNWASLKLNSRIPELSPPSPVPSLKNR